MSKKNQKIHLPVIRLAKYQDIHYEGLRSKSILYQHLEGHKFCLGLEIVRRIISLQIMSIFS